MPVLCATGLPVGPNSALRQTNPVWTRLYIADGVGEDVAPGEAPGLAVMQRTKTAIVWTVAIVFGCLFGVIVAMHLGGAI